MGTKNNNLELKEESLAAYKRYSSELEKHYKNDDRVVVHSGFHKNLFFFEFRVSNDEISTSTELTFLPNKKIKCLQLIVENSSGKTRCIEEFKFTDSALEKVLSSLLPFTAKQ